VGDSDVTLHPLLAARWSPTVFDAGDEATSTDVATILEAARRAPSAGNAQPWGFVVGRRGDPVHTRLASYLTGSSRPWASTASLLVANLCHRFVEDTDWDYSEFALYDLGQAVAHMTVQAQALGLFARQFRAFDRDGIAAEFAVPPHWEVTTMTAFGRVPGDVHRPAAKDLARPRRPLTDIEWPIDTA
jgi:hypothetical protein